MKKISIIVPVYNSQTSVASTIDSLLEQTYKNIEIVCVDDGSSDHSRDILEEYSRAYPNSVKTLHQENAGVSAARNTGIEAASGDIIMFVDADDALVPYACERVCDIFEKTGAEVVTFGFLCRPEEAMPLGMSKVLMPPSKAYLEFEPSLLFSDAARPYICRTAIARELLVRESIRFEPGISLGEDQIIYFLVYPLARKTVLAPEQLYIYNMHNESATHANGNDPAGVSKRLSQHFAVVEAVLREWKQRGLSSLCQSEMLEWALDFLAFDINSLNQGERVELFTRLSKDLNWYFGPDAIEQESCWSAKRCLRDIQQIAESASAKNSTRNCKNCISISHLAMFYLKRYGFVRCFQQLLIGLGLLKKWK